MESKLEVGLDWDRYLSNKVDVNENNKSIVYFGEAIGICCRDRNVMGKAKLSKYERIDTSRRKLEITNIFPPIFKIKNIPYAENKRIWLLSTGKNVPLNSNGNCFSSDDGFKKELRNKSMERGFILSESLIELVFGPIEPKILEIYNKGNEYF